MLIGLYYDIKLQFEADIDALIYIYIKDYASKMPCENN